jgi:hypothetical protein
MSIESCLQEEAEQAALSIQSRIGELEREIRNKTQERAKLVDELSHARLASNRLEKYQTVYGSNILCPYCWVGRGKLATLARIEYGDGREVLRCSSCLTELSLNDSEAASDHASF